MVYFILQLDDEVERRKDLGFTFQQLLRKELDILNEDEKGREEHQISFSAAVSETMRVLNGLTESTTSLTHLDRQRYSVALCDRIGTGVCTTEYHSTTEYQFFYFSYKM
jgi:hypothetical protein